MTTMKGNTMKEKIKRFVKVHEDSLAIAGATAVMIGVSVAVKATQMHIYDKGARQGRKELIDTVRSFAPSEEN